MLVVGLVVPAAASASDAGAPRGACVDTQMESAPVFDSPGFEALSVRLVDDGPVRWCESPDSPECRDGSEAPGMGLDMGSEMSGMHDAHPTRDAAEHSPPRERHERPVTTDGTRPAYGLGVDRPPAR